MHIQPETLIREFTRELRNKNAGIFAGAGLSMPSGYVDWKTLLRNVIQDLGLDPDLESDLVTVAQYYCNRAGGNRAQLSQTIFDHFSQTRQPTPNHEILARLPIQTYWTTNYDKLIEQSLADANKVPDVKYTLKQLPITRQDRDVVIYKMHGDVNHSADAVITKDDYEKYPHKMSVFVSALKGDLIEKTFLFIGFSFSDPNIDYILSRVRAIYEENQRHHYCILRSVSQKPDESGEAFAYRKLKQDYFVSDLSRFGIQTVLVSDYGEITALLKQIEDRYKQGSVFISAAAHDFGKWTESEANEFFHKLSHNLVSSGKRVITGFGVGIGSAVINGALSALDDLRRPVSEDHLVMRPFPQVETGGTSLKDKWTAYRKGMISEGGIALFGFGNKLLKGEVVESGGMIEEFELAKAAGLKPIPLGCTGYASEAIWNIVNSSFEEFYPGASEEMKRLFQQLNQEPESLGHLLTTTTKLIEQIQED